MSKPVIILAIMLLSLGVISQDVSYRVFFYQGNVLLKPVKGSWTKIAEIDTRMYPGDSIALEAGSDLYFFDANNALYNISDQGKYGLKRLTDSLKVLEGTSLVIRYAAFIWEEFRKSHDDFEEDAKGHMREKGGVSRAPNIPEIYSPCYGTCIIEDEIRFIWENTGVPGYTISCWDSGQHGNCIFRTTTEDTSLVISTHANWMPDAGMVFYYSITEGKKPASNLFPIKVLNSSEKQHILDEENKIIHSNEFSGISKDLVLAAFYEENRLFRQASRIYHEMINADPDNPMIREYYFLYLERNQLTSFEK